jgi:hypothetical protein
MARRRPGAWYIPVLAPGRMRALSRTGKAAHMSIWHRAPREVYRVYGEDEYPGGKNTELGYGEDDTTISRASTTAEGSTIAADAVAETPWSERPTPGNFAPGVRSDCSQRSQPGRLVGFGLLTGAILGTLCLVVLNMSHRHVAMSRPGAQVVRIGAGVEGGGAVVGRAPAIHRPSSRGAPSDSKPSQRTQRVSASFLGAFTRRSEQVRRLRAPTIGSVSPSRFDLTQPSTSRPANSGALAPVAAEPYLTDDEFGFEQ